MEINGRLRFHSCNLFYAGIFDLSVMIDANVGAD